MNVVFRKGKEREMKGERKRQRARQCNRERSGDLSVFRLGSKELNEMWDRKLSLIHI